MLRIAIDGPGGAGKSTLAKALAQKLGIVYVDTGALYRTVGLFADRNDVDPTDRIAVSKLITRLNVELTYEDGVQIIYMKLLSLYRLICIVLLQIYLIHQLVCLKNMMRNI